MRIFLLAMLFPLAACAPHEGPDLGKLSTKQLERVEKTCFMSGRRDERGARYPSEYCARVSMERAERLVKEARG